MHVLYTFSVLTVLSSIVTGFSRFSTIVFYFVEFCSNRWKRHHWQLILMFKRPKIKINRSDDTCVMTRVYFGTVNSYYAYVHEGGIYFSAHNIRHINVSMQMSCKEIKTEKERKRKRERAVAVIYVLRIRNNTRARAHTESRKWILNRLRLFSLFFRCSKNIRVVRTRRQIIRW